MVEATLVLTEAGHRLGTSPSGITVGAIRLRGWQIHSIAGQPAAEADRRHYLVRISYDLLTEPDAPAPKWYEVGFALGTADDECAAVVVDALPRGVLREQAATSYSLDRGLGFGPGSEIHLPPVDPTVDVFGLGGPEIRWRHSAVDDAGVRPGAHTTWMTLAVARDCLRVPVTLTARFDIDPKSARDLLPAGQQATFVLELAMPTAAVTADAPPVDRSAPEVPRVFISYTHDDEEHVDAVRLFSVFLAETCGLDMHMDRWDLDNRRDWSLWARAQLAAADYVLVIASPMCRTVGDGRMDNLVHRGMQSEMALIRELLHGDRATWTTKLLPVVLPGHSADEIPLFLLPQTADHYIVTDLTIAGADSLLRVLTGQPYDRKPATNPRLVRLPTRPDANEPASSNRTDPKGPDMSDNSTHRPPNRQPHTPGRTSGPAGPSITNQGVMTGAITAGGSVDISNTTKLVNYARRNPFVVVAAIVVVALVVYLLIVATGRGETDGAAGTGAGSSVAASAVSPAVNPAPSNSSSTGVTVDPSKIVGTWTASDGTGQKTFSGNGSRCDGFFYNAGAPLDIGGPMYCTLSSKPDAQNRYNLLVTQSGNRAVYTVAFSDEDNATVFDSSGRRLYGLSRF